MDIFAFVHLLFTFFPIILFITYLTNIAYFTKLFHRHNIKYLSPLLLLYYAIPISWALLKGKCVFTQMERHTKNTHIFTKFPSAPFLPLHMNGLLENLFGLLNITYNNKNMFRLIIAINIIDFIIVWYFTSPYF
jgi:hypothetical protein